MKGISLKDNLRNRKHNKFSYYSRAYLNKYLKPSIKSMDSLLSPEPKNLEYLLDRRDYYCSDIKSSGRSEISNLKNYSKPKNYYIDLYEVLKVFPSNYYINHLFGDISEEAEELSFVKSRPINQEGNSVLLKLNHIRHFYFVNDSTSFDSKESKLIWRGAVWKRQLSRQKFFDVHGDNQKLDVGLVKGMSSYFPKYEKPFLTIEEQLKSKLILSLEGNDVATNLKWIMSSNSIPVMPKPTCETWFMEGRLIPDKHYLEVAQDFSNLEDRIEELLSNKSLSEEIIHAGNEYVKDFQDDRQEKLLQLMVAEKALINMGNEPFLSKRYDWMKI